uniref:Tetraspanin-9 n=1 Tax=Ciona intestinalis TaxID=7719 RepID=A0A1W2W6B4_CIOIN|nr:tetraspanin-9 [Ciona intestinalis]|eukprot:XP_018671832.1 tetraspanin-9 [Ciona intestinalis]
MENSSTKCAKCMLVLFNMIFFIGGVVLAGLAGYGAFNKNSPLHSVVVEMKSTILLDGLYLLFAVGLFLALISLIGCWGAMSESKCLLYSYFSVMLVVFLVQMSGIIICFVKYQAIKGMVLKALQSRTTIDPSHLKQSLVNKATNVIFDKFETKYHCCGFYGPSDYLSAFPDSCYAKVHARNKRAANSSATTNPTIASVSAVLTTAAKIVATTQPATAAATHHIATTPEATTPIATTAAHHVATTAEASTAAPTAAITTKPVIHATVAAHTASAVTTASHSGTTAAPASHGALYTKGCGKVLKPYLYAAGGIAIVILIMELVVLFLACCMISAINQGYTPV